MNEIVLQVLGWAVWLSLAAATVAGIRHYARRKGARLGFWQFTFMQLLILMSIATLFAWMAWMWYTTQFASPS